MDGTQIALLVAGLSSLAYKVVKKYLGEVDHQVYTGLTALVTMALGSLTSLRADVFQPLKLFLVEKYWYFGCLSIIALLCYLRPKGLVRLLTRVPKEPPSQKPSFHLHQLTTLTALANYIRQRPRSFPTVKTFYQGQHLAQPLYAVTSASVRCYVEALEPLYYPSLDIDHPIKDSHLTGTMKWTLSFSKMEVEMGVTKTTEISLPRFSVVIRADSFNKLNDFMEEIKQSHKYAILSRCQGITVLTDNEVLFNHVHVLPPLPPLDGEALARHEFDSFFHPRRAEILMMLISVQFHSEELLAKGLSTSLGFIAHGPPGCGKSLLGYKAARALRRMPISIDLSKVKTVKEAYQLMYAPHFAGTGLKPRETLIMLDEFDEVVEGLVKEDEYFSIEALSGGTKGTTEGPILLHPGNLPLGDDPGEKVLDREDLSRVNSTFSFFRSFKRTMQSRLTINGLLKLLQGPLPHDGSILVASTNFLERIVAVREAMTRPGRLTPFLFDYPGKVVIDQMSRFYFDVPFEEEIPKLVGTEVSALTGFVSTLVARQDMDQGAKAKLFHDEIRRRVDLL